MTLLAVEKMLEAGLTVTMNVAASGGDTFKNTKANVCLLAKNDDAAPTNITVTAQRTSKEVAGYGSMTKADLVVTVAAGAEKIIGPFPRKAFNDSGELVNLTYSSVTSLTIGVMEMEDID